MNEPLHGDYQILGELRKLDEKILRLQLGAVAIPAELKKLEDEVEKRSQELAVMKASFEATEKGTRKAEGELREKEDFLHKAESKMMEVKTNTEYQAALRENEAQKKDKDRLEELALSMMGQVDEGRKSVRAAEGAFKDFDAGISRDRQKMEEERRVLTAELDGLLKHRADLTQNLSPYTGSLYRRLIQTMKGTVITLAENSKCLGCHMRVPPQLYNEILGVKQIHQCPSCRKILVAPPNNPQAAATGS